MEQDQRLDFSAKVAFEQWWGEQTRKGDPARRPNLVRDAFLAAFEIGYASGNRYGWKPNSSGVMGGGEMVSCDPAPDAARGPGSVGKTYKL